MTYSTIDGDISDFFDLAERAREYRTEELRTFLVTEGHSMSEAIAGIIEWQRSRLEALDPSWDRFRLSSAGIAAVEQLRDERTSAGTAGSPDDASERLRDA